MINIQFIVNVELKATDLRYNIPVTRTNNNFYPVEKRSDIIISAWDIIFTSGTVLTSVDLGPLGAFT
jgi:hypothetical protein